MLREASVERSETNTECTEEKMKRSAIFLIKKIQKKHRRESRRKRGLVADFNDFSAFSGFIFSCLLLVFSKLFFVFFRAFVFSWSFGFGFARLGWRFALRVFMVSYCWIRVSICFGFQNFKRWAILRVSSRSSLGGDSRGNLPTRLRSCLWGRPRSCLPTNPRSRSRSNSWSSLGSDLGGDSGSHSLICYTI